MNDSTAFAPITPAVQIGMRGLVNLTNNMISGGLYVLIAETPSARFPMLAESLGIALKEGTHCTVIVSANHPDLFLQRVESFDSYITPELIVANRLQLFEMQDQFSTTMFRFGAEGFVRELEYFGIPENSYLIFDQADELLSLHDISQALDQIDVLGKWLSQRQVTALLVFSRVTEAHANTINALMDNLTGIVRLGGNRDGLELTFDYWQSPDGTIAARSYRLLTLDSGLYEATTNIAPSEQGMVEGSTELASEEEDAEPHFFYMDPDLGVWPSN
ncbi:MAG: BcsE family c-di-GMP-binding protein [Rhodoferax sp.]